VPELERKSAAALFAANYREITATATKQWSFPLFPPLSSFEFELLRGSPSSTRPAISSSFIWIVSKGTVRARVMSVHTGLLPQYENETVTLPVLS
jgi:hypothetical protein